MNSIAPIPGHGDRSALLARLEWARDATALYKLPARESHVLQFFAGYGARVYLNRARIMAETGMSAATVKRALRKLRDLGLVDRERAPAPGHPAVYRLNAGHQCPPNAGHQCPLEVEASSPNSSPPSSSLVDVVMEEEILL